VNRSFKVIWSHSKRCFVAVSELVSRRGKSSKSTVTASGETSVGFSLNGVAAAMVAAGLMTGYAQPALAQQPTCTISGENLTTVLVNSACDVTIESDALLTASPGVLVTGASLGNVSIVNNGTISNDSSNAIGISVLSSGDSKSSTLFSTLSIDNQGDIVSTGSGSVGIRLSVDKSLLEIGKATISNSGLIQSVSSAIEVSGKDNTSITEPLLIQNSGILASDGSTIKLNFSTLSFETDTSGKVGTCSGGDAFSDQTKCVSATMSSGFTWNNSKQTCVGDSTLDKTSKDQCETKNAGYTWTPGLVTTVSNGVATIENSGLILGGKDGAINSDGVDVTVTNFESGVIIGSINGKNGAVIDVSNEGVWYLPFGTSGDINNYTQADEGLVVFEISGNKSATLKVTSSAILENNQIGVIVGGPLNPGDSKSGILVLNAIGGSVQVFDPEEDVLSSLTEGNSLRLLDPSNFRVYDNSLQYNFSAIWDDKSNQLRLVPGEDFCSASTFAGVSETKGTGNTRDLGRMLDNQSGALADPSIFSSKGFNRLLLELVNLPGGGCCEIDSSMQNLLPVMSSAVGQATLAAVQAGDRTLHERMHEISGLSSGDPSASERRAWARLYGSELDQKETNRILGYKSRTSGIALGGDKRISSDMQVGAALLYSDTKVSDRSSTVNHSANARGYQVSLYGARDIDANTFFLFQGGVGRQEVSTTRNVEVGAISERALGSYNSTVLSASARLGRDYGQKQDLTFTPSVSLAYASVKSKGYTETGAPITGLSVDSDRAEELKLAFDGKVTRKLDPATRVFASVGLGYDLIDQQSSVGARFSGASDLTTDFVTPGADRKPFFARGSAGVNIMSKDNLELMLKYDVESRDRYLDQSATIYLRKLF
jgi:outer membrane autotransporter protein